MLCERVWVFIPFEQTKSLSIKLLVALLSKKALTKWSLLVSVVPISTSRSREVPCVSKVLIEKSLGSFLSHLGLWSETRGRGRKGGVSASSLSIVLGSSIVNTVNLFTGDQSTLIAGHSMQNPFSLGDKTLLLELHPSMSTNLQLAPPAVPRWVDGHSCSGSSLRLDGSHLYISNILTETRVLLSESRRCP